MTGIRTECNKLINNVAENDLKPILIGVIAARKLKLPCGISGRFGSVVYGKLVGVTRLEELNRPTYCLLRATEQHGLNYENQYFFNLNNTTNNTTFAG